MATLETYTASEEQEAQRVDFGVMLDELAENMRKYDGLMAQKAPLLDAKEAMDAQLEDLDIDTPAEHYPEVVARNALEKLLLDKRIRALDQQLRPFDWSFTASFTLLRNLKGEKIEIEPINPERRGLFQYSGTGDERAFAGITTKAKKGKIKDIKLDAREGGSIIISGRVWSYEATSLIDRENDYTPNFSIRYVD